VERAFLDANVLFSAAYRRDAGLRRLWRLRAVTLVSSAYAIEEARINLDTDEQRARLMGLVNEIEAIPEPPEPPDLPAGVKLPLKDQPIFAAAIAAGCGYLITGDWTHFGPYMDKKIAGVKVATPAAFLDRYSA
jgi:hypothetical protein